MVLKSLIFYHGVILIVFYDFALFLNEHYITRTLTQFETNKFSQNLNVCRIFKEKKVVIVTFCCGQYIISTTNCQKAFFEK